MVDAVALGLVTGSPTLGTPVVAPIYNLTATGLVTGAPTLGQPRARDVVPWMFRPLRQSTETLEWATDILQSFNSEMRVSLRPARQSFTYAYNIRDPRNARAEALVRAFPRSDYIVPVWHEQSPTGALTGAETVLPVEDAHDWRAGGNAVIWGGCDAWVIRQVASVGSGEITLQSPVGQSFTSAIAMPARFCYLDDGGWRADRIRERGISAAAVTFVSRDPPPAGVSPWPQYQGLDLVTKCGTVEALAASFVPRTGYVDSALGQVSLEEVRRPIDARYSMSWRIANPAQLQNRVQWLHYLRGRDRAFWLRDWARDLTLQAQIGAAATTILVKPTLPRVADYIGRSLLIDGDPRAITNAVWSGANHLLTISSAIGRIVPVTARVGFLRKVRLDTDTVEFAHTHGFVSTVRLPLIEVPE
jgi:hypothetical protein